MIGRSPLMRRLRRRSDRLAVSGLAYGLACILALTTGPLAAAAQSQQRPPQKAKMTLPALAAQGFEVKAGVGSYLVLQRGKDVWFCYMLETRSDCEPAE